jgi:DNA-binding response OmpR family regulator
MAIVLSMSKDKELLFLRNSVLESAGFEVVAAIRPDEAVETLKARPIDAVLIGHMYSRDEALSVATFAKSQAHPIKVCLLQKVKIFSAPEFDSYIDALAGPEELIACMRAALKMGKEC